MEGNLRTCKNLTKREKCQKIITSVVSQVNKKRGFSEQQNDVLGSRNGNSTLLKTRRHTRQSNKYNNNPNIFFYYFDNLFRRRVPVYNTSE